MSLPPVTSDKAKARTTKHHKGASKARTSDASANSDGKRVDDQTGGPKTFWVVMRAHKWNAIKVGPYHIAAKQAGPQRFIPVFDTKAQAVAWAGSDEYVYEIQTVEDSQ